MFRYLQKYIKDILSPTQKAKKELKTWKNTIPHRGIFRRDKGTIPEWFEINEEELYLCLIEKGQKYEVIPSFFVDFNWKNML